MPIETWKTRKAEPTAHAKRALAVSHGEDRVLQHARVGEPLTKSAPENQRGEHHASAAQYNGNAPYRDLAAEAKAKAENRDKRCLANDNTCMGWATSSGYCRPHSVGVAESFKKATE